ncbi:MAG: OsmC family protein [Candidatus Thermoplasmatota archaeon]|nr:OsmC family protein [Candidatus Thermoplasmatota archaeon]
MEMEITFSGGKKVNADFNGFTVVTDQPIAEGGSGTDPAPFDFFLVSIGTCTGYYALMFCQKNNIATEGMKLVMKCEQDKGTHLIETIHIAITLPKGFPEKYKKAVIRSAEACTVKKHLETPPKFDIQVVLQ